LLRRQKNHIDRSDINHYTDKVLCIDLERGAVELEGRTIDLSMTEYSLLACLVRNLGRTVTHRQLLHEVWGCEYGDISTKLTFYIHNLRKKLRNSHENHEYIHTRWGQGYCFVPLNGT
jgi:two-component system KDP operon response regulator KdpE